MELTDRTLQSIKAGIDDTFSGYSKGWNDAKTTKEYFRDLQKELNGKISFQQSRLKQLTNPTDANRNNAVLLATSKDIGLIKQSMKDGIEKANFSFVLSLGDLIANSNSYSNAEKFAVKCFLQEAQQKSGYTRELDILNQANVIKTELDAFQDFTGTDGIKEVLSKVSSKKFLAELSYVRDKEKSERLTT